MVFLGLAFAIATAGLSAAQTGAIDREPAPASQRPEPQAEGGWRIPVLHAAGTLAAMRISASIVWPQAYDPTRLPDQFRGLERAWSRLPEFRRDRPLLGSDGERFQLGRWLREGASTPVRTILLVATDPFGELERRVFRTRC
jgi:hypothetical protein